MWALSRKKIFNQTTVSVKSQEISEPFTDLLSTRASHHPSHSGELCQELGVTRHLVHSLVFTSWGCRPCEQQLLLNLKSRLSQAASPHFQEFTFGLSCLFPSERVRWKLTYQLGSWTSSVIYHSNAHILMWFFPSIFSLCVHLHGNRWRRQREANVNIQWLWWLSSNALNPGRTAVCSL